ncbi:phenylalanine--tRNA ligase subunit beta [Psychroflexus maritimus]|uniref:Phenylalanine--tRNA ligase beta subunit n=1 Tax=Psychroflexus maritimus TaxID=2714865 RepID=A0A967DXR1_9FLAO|nr:phenylalanine--tRNA ligase subunit beta [Psychroflexus maritimus]NGZ88970.1 phenylalanine--tRNA ligase subunit beta [Psychroflexus maritimus]
MKISYNWLKQFINTDLSTNEADALLTDLGLEVEGVTNFESVKGGLEGVVVGHVTECKKHPNADKLKLTKVNIGEGEELQIVCGAPNVAEGQKVPVATIGTTLYDEKGEAWKIKKGKIRGEASHGMICAEDELGFGESHDGIMVLAEDFQPGTPLKDIFEVEIDQVFEIGLTPNRADAMSHWGVARDLRAGLIQLDKNTPLNTPAISNFHVEERSRKIAIEVKESKLAPRYAGITISGVSVKASPTWLQNRLKAIGLKPINNIVDATNYVLHELGQPLHAFDADKIRGNKIVVQTLKKGTKFITLDEVERELHEDDLMICDEEKPLCIAGVFGGLDSGVTQHTSSIFLESAYFDPVSVRKTAKRHGLNTDASFRFERGIDPNITEYALKRAVILIQEIAGGKVSSDIDDLYPKKIEDFQVFLSFKKINDLIGHEIDTNVIKNILSSLEIKVNNVTESGLGLTIPAYRVDVQREVDVIEEILRIYGYNNIPLNEKFNVSVSLTNKFDDHKIQQITAQQLVGKGFSEIMSNSLTTAKYTEFSNTISAENQVEMLNPLSQDLAVMRQSMLFSGLESIAYNLNRKNENLKFFEFGKTYHKYTEKYEEPKHLSLLVTGNKNPESWTNAIEKTNFFYFKGIVESILQRLGIKSTTIKTAKSSVFNEAITIFYNKKALVSFGTVQKSILKKFDIEQEVLFADFNWDEMLEASKTNQFTFEEIPKYPAVRRDFALLLNEHIRFNELEEIALKLGKKLLKKVDLFDVYLGKNLPEGKKSYAIKFIFQDENKTLTDKQVDKLMSKFQQQFEKQLGASLR